MGRTRCSASGSLIHTSAPCIHNSAIPERERFWSLNLIRNGCGKPSSWAKQHSAVASSCSVILRIATYCSRVEAAVSLLWSDIIPTSECSNDSQYSTPHLLLDLPQNLSICPFCSQVLFCFLPGSELKKRHHLRISGSGIDPEWPDFRDVYDQSGMRDQMNQESVLHGGPTSTTLLRVVPPYVAVPSCDPSN